MPNETSKGLVLEVNCMTITPEGAWVKFEKAAGVRKSFFK
jgi:hypothetical protein